MASCDRLRLRQEPINTTEVGGVIKMITQLQKARDERRLTSNNYMAFEFIIAGIGCFVFSLITLFLLPNNTPLLITSQILFFGVIILIIAIVSILYIVYNKIINGD